MIFRFSLIAALTAFSLTATQGNQAPIFHQIPTSSIEEGSTLSFVQRESGLVSTLAGGSGDGQGYRDGSGDAAQFNDPHGIAADSKGNLFVADRNNRRIRKITSDGTVSTFAGDGGYEIKHGPGIFASIGSPERLAISPDGDLYVSTFVSSPDSAFVILKITSEGEVATLLHSAGYDDSMDGESGIASLGNLQDLAYDHQRKLLYFSDANNNTIRKLDLNLQPSDPEYVSTLAGSGNDGYAEGTGTAAQFKYPRGIDLDSAGNIYVADSWNARIRKVTPEGEVSTIAGDGTHALEAVYDEAPQINSPDWLVVAQDRYVYVPTFGRIKVIDLENNNAVSTLLGSDSHELTDGEFDVATFGNEVFSIAFTSGKLFLANVGEDTETFIYAHKIRQVEFPGLYVEDDGNSLTADLSVTNGTLSVTLSGSSTILSGANESTNFSIVGTIGDLNDTLTTLEFTPDEDFTGEAILTYTATDGALSSETQSTRINIYPKPLVPSEDLTVTALGPVFGIQDSTIPLVGSGYVSTIAGGESGYKDGLSLQAQFAELNGIVANSKGDLFIADGFNYRIRKLSPDGIVSTFVGNGEEKVNDGSGINTSIGQPLHLAIGPMDELYVASYTFMPQESIAISKITPEGEVTKIIHSTEYYSSMDGPAEIASLGVVRGIAYDSDRNFIYFSDATNGTIRKIDLNVEPSEQDFVSTLAGSGSNGFADGTGSSASFNDPAEIQLDSLGNIYVADSQNHRIRKVTPEGVVTTIAGSGDPGNDEDFDASLEVHTPRNLLLVNDRYLSTVGLGRIRVIDLQQSNEVTTLFGRNDPEYTDGDFQEANVTHDNVSMAFSRNKIFMTNNGYDALNFSESRGVRRIDLPGPIVVSGLADAVITATFSIEEGMINATLAGDTTLVDGELESASFTIEGSEEDINATLQTFRYTPTTGYFGDTKITYSATDGENYSGEQESVVTVILGPRDPVLATIGNQTTDKNTPLTLTLSATDENGDDLTYSVTSSQNVTANINGTTLMIMPAPNWEGSDSITVTVDDGFDGTDTEIITVTVESFNHPPATNDLAGISGSQDTAIPVYNENIQRFIAGSTSSGFEDGLSTNAKFRQPYDIVADSQGNLIVADSWNDRIRKISPSGIVSTLAGNTNNGLNDGPGHEAEIYLPSFLTLGEEDSIYFTHSSVDSKYHVRKVSASGEVTSILRSTQVYTQARNGNGTTAVLGRTKGIVYDPVSNAIYVSDDTLHSIRKIDLNVSPSNSNYVTTFAGTGSSGFQDGIGTSASFRNPSGLAVDSTGNLYVVDRSNNRVRKITTNAEVSTLSYTANGPTAFTALWNLTLADDNTLLLIDSGKFKKVQLDQDNYLSTIWDTAYNGNSLIYHEGNILYTKSSSQYGVLARYMEYPIIVSDYDSGQVTTHLSVNNGTLSVTLVGQAMISTGANESASFSIQGSPQDINHTLRTLTLHPEAGFTGNATLTYSVEDEENTSLSKNIAITVEGPQNTPPVLGDIEAVTITEDSQHTLELSATDEDGDALTFASEGSDHITATIQQTTLVLSPAANWYGQEEITVTVDDGNDGTDSVSFEVTVTAVNDAPVLNQISNQTLNEDTPVTINLVASDIEDPELTYTAESSEHITATLQASALTLTPAPNWYGNESITVTATDTNEGTHSRTFEVTVVAINDAPVLETITPQTTPEDTPLTINLVAMDVDDTNLSFSAQNSQNISATIQNSTLTLSPASNWYGTDSITVTVSDTGNETQAQTFDVTVTQVNDAPVLTNIGNQATQEDVSLTINLSATDVDDTNLTFTVESSDHITAIIQNSTLTLTPETHWHGTEAITVTVSDDENETASETFEFHVQSVNNPPKLDNITDLEIDQDTSLTIHLSASDLDQDTLQYSVLSPDEVTATLTGASLTLAPNTGWHGEANITITVSDGNGGTDSIALLLTVNEVEEIIPSGYAESPPNLYFDTTSDSDNDGLTDAEEINFYGTNPNDADSDDNGINDGEQVGIDRDPPTTNPDTTIETYPPVVSTLEVEEGYRLMGEIDFDGEDDIITAGFRLSYSATFHEDMTRIFNVQPNEAGIFSQEVLTFDSPGMHYVQAFASNNAGITYGFVEHFEPNPPQSDIWEGATPLGDTGWQDTVFGVVFIQPGSSWIFHGNWGWLYVEGTSADNVWFWNETNGWHWTRQDIYPYLYRQSQGGWVYWMTDNQQKPISFNASTGEYEDGI